MPNRNDETQLSTSAASATDQSAKETPNRRMRVALRYRNIYSAPSFHTGSMTSALKSVE